MGSLSRCYRIQRESPAARHYPSEFLDKARIHVYHDGTAYFRAQDDAVEALFTCPSLDELLSQLRLTSDDLLVVVAETSSAAS